MIIGIDLGGMSAKAALLAGEKLEGKVVTYLASGSHHVIVGVDMAHLLENPLKSVPPIPTTSATAGGINPHAEESEPASTRNGGTSKCCLLI